jgi:hypothetical protein
MSNNIFLKTKELKIKELNNRFSFLEEEYNKNSSIKEYPNKSKRKNIEYHSSQNSFTQPRPDRNRDRDRDRDRDFNRNNKRNNNFLPKITTPSTSSIIEPDVNNPILFPDLVPIKNKEINNQLEKSSKFTFCG